MDNRQLETLECLYEFLINKPKVKKDELCSCLSVSINNLEQLLSELLAMGLNLVQNSNRVELLDFIEPIDLTNILLQLQKAQINKPLKYFFSTVSTNQLARLDNSESLYLSDHQSEGRGRQDRKWLTPLGQSIALSIKHKFKLPLKDLAGLNIAIAVATIKATIKCNHSHLKLKWPNDILSDGAKVAGILLEASGNSQHSTVIIGIGINWNLRESLLESIAQKCTNIGINTITRSDFIALLIIEVEKILIEFSKHRLKNILAKWNQFDAYINEDINILQGSDTYQGTYIGVTSSGALQIQINNKIKTLASGEVSIRKVCDN